MVPKEAEQRSDILKVQAPCHEELLFADLEHFDRKLAHWLLFYNAQRPHQSLGQQPPLHFLLQHQPECQRWWTHTIF
jgi:transposase InsO family protein